MQKLLTKNVFVALCATIFVSCVCLSFVIDSKANNIERNTLTNNIIQKPLNNLFIDLNKPTTKPLYYPKNIYIFTYHYVENVTDKKDTLRKSLSISPVTFEEHLRLIKEKKYSDIFVKDIPKILENKNDNIKYISLTFDDGYRDFYDKAFPLLKKYNIKSTLYVVPAFLNRKDYLTYSQLKEISESNLVEIGSHTMNHLDLTNPQTKNLDYEILTSKKYLENILGHTIYTFSYPYGRYNKQLVELTIKSGYTNAVSTDNGFVQNGDNLFFLQRIRAGGLPLILK